MRFKKLQKEEISAIPTLSNENLLEFTFDYFYQITADSSPDEREEEIYKMYKAELYKRLKEAKWLLE